MYCVPKNVAGVYALRHVSTDLIYVGVSAVCVYNRLKWHFVKLRQGTHPTRRLQELWRGEVNDFEQILLQECPRGDKNICQQREMRWMNEFSDKLLNSSLSEAAQRRWADPEYKAKQAAARPEAMQRRREAGSWGRAAWSDENKKSFSEKMSAKAKERLENGTFGPATWTEESLRKFRETRRDKRQSNLPNRDE